MIFFDLDNSLIDHDKATFLAIDELYETFAKYINFTKTEAQLLWQKIARKHYNNYLAQKISYQKKEYLCIEDFFAHNNPGNPLKNKIREGAKVFAACYEKNWRLFTDVIPVLENLQTYQLGIITNGSYREQYKKLTTLGIEKYFTVILAFSRTRIAKAKANSKIYFKACEVINKKPQQCWYIGDDFEKDVLPASRAKFNTIWLNRKNLILQDPILNHIYNINNLFDLLRIIKCHSK
jgi:putative hydrolase of the HAD superfamily